MNQLNSMMKSAAESLVSHVQSYFDECDQICLPSDVMNKDDDSNQSLMSTSGFCVVLTTSANQHKWGQFSTAGMPQFITELFTSKKETLAHTELNTEKDITRKLSPIK